MQQAIAILDSGVGGLTVVKEIIRQLPKEPILYFGDTARAPYGPRSAEEIRKFTGQVVDYLLQYRPKLIVMACNTATAVALEEIRARVAVPVIGVIHSGVRAAIKKTRVGSIGVIGTEGTIRSGAYEQALRRIAPHIRVFSQACPRLVPLVEKGIFSGEDTSRTVAESLAAMKAKKLDCLILGCTHYPFLADVIADVMGEQVKLINSAEETAWEISAILCHNRMLAGSQKPAEHRFFCSGDPELFRRIGQRWLGEELDVAPVLWKMVNTV